MGLFSSKRSKNKYATLTSKSKLTVDIVDDNKWKKCNQCNEIIYNEDLKNNKIENKQDYVILIGDY